MILFYGRYSPSVWAVICKGEIVYKKFFKRFFDIITSLIAILLTALPLLVICIIVKCESKGPAIFKGERVGKDGNHDIKVGFAEPRSDGESNAKIANILEYGRHGQPAKPFLKPAKSRSKSACEAAMKQKFEEEIDKL